MLPFDLAGSKDVGFGFDLGGQAFLPSDDFGALRQPFWSFGAVLKNLLQPELKLAEEKETFPRELRGGVSVSFAALSRASLGSGVVRHDRAELSTSFRKVAGEPGLHPGLGFSYAYENMLVFRLGYDKGLAAGVGLRTGDGKFCVDYAIENKPLSMNHRFTLSYRFIQPQLPARRPVAEERDEDYARALRAKVSQNTLERPGLLQDQQYRRSGPCVAPARSRGFRSAAGSGGRAGRNCGCLTPRWTRLWPGTTPRPTSRRPHAGCGGDRERLAAVLRTCRAPRITLSPPLPRSSRRGVSQLCGWFGGGSRPARGNGVCQTGTAAAWIA